MEAVTQIATRSPRKTYAFWLKELAASKKMLDGFHKQGTKIIDRYLDQRQPRQEGFRLNLFHANVKTVGDMLYGNLPKVEASRSFADAADDIARVAAEIVERINNLDIQQNGQEFDSVLRSCLQDRLLPGLGVARVRYEYQEQTVPVPDPVSGQMIPQTVVVNEDAPVEYYHWQDVLWGWGRSFAELPWVAFRSYLSKEEVIERFGPEYADKVQYKTQKLADTEGQGGNKDEDAPWQKAEVWEIWDKVLKQTVWFSEGCEKLLDRKDDPLRLRGFFPCPPFLLANQTTSLYKPTADYHLAQDLYNEIDNLQRRISIITDAVRVVGVYNAAEGTEAITRMFNEGSDNDLIPIDSWAVFAESGGLQGNIEWLPLADIVNALDKLTQIRDQYIALLEQQTGMSDILRGQLASPYEGVGQSQIKAQWGSVHIQALQDEFARFVSDLFQLRTEVICTHFDPETIARRANMQASVDAEIVPQAVQLLKDPEQVTIRVQVRSESVAMEDFARLRNERTEFLNAMATFMQSAAPMVQQEPAAMPYLLQMLQWSMSGFKGSQEIEGVLDKAIEGALQKAQQPQPDPNAAEKAKQEGELAKIKAKAEADMQLRQQDLAADMQTAQAAHQAKMAEIMAAHQARLAEVQHKLRADVMKEQIVMQANIRQTEAAADAEVMKDALTAEMDLERYLREAEIDLQTESEKSLLKIQEAAAASQARISAMVRKADDAE